MTEQIQNTTIKAEKHAKIMIIIFLFISIPLTSNLLYSLLIQNFHVS